jgi:hypothetical protein
METGTRLITPLSSLSAGSFRKEPGLICSCLPLLLPQVQITQKERERVRERERKIEREKERKKIDR